MLVKSLKRGSPWVGPYSHSLLEKCGSYATMHRLCVGPQGIQYRVPLQSWIVGLAIHISEGPLSISHWLGLGVELFLPARARGRVRIAVSPHWLGLGVELG